MSTLGTIRANVRRNLGETTARFYTNADLNSFIGEAYGHYSLKMIEEGDGYFETTTYLNLVSGTPTIDISGLSPAFLTISMLWRMTSTAQFPLFPKETRFTPVSTVFSAAGDAYRPTFKMQGTNIVLEPTPQSSETGSATSGLKLDYNYIPTIPTSASADGFTFDTCFPTIHEPMIELYATIRAMEAKDGMGGVSDIATFRATLATKEQVFMDSLTRMETSDRAQYSGTDYTNMVNWRYY